MDSKEAREKSFSCNIQLKTEHGVNLQFKLRPGNLSAVGVYREKLGNTGPISWLLFSTQAFIN